MAYYGTDTLGDDRYVFDFVLDACLGADQMGADFTKYDNNDDGFVDFVYIIYAGVGQADGGPETTIWPHAWDLKATLYYGNHNQNTYYANSATDYYLPQIDGKTLMKYACSNELKYSNQARSGIGTICHEFSHVLGLPDYYLTTTSPVVNQRETPGAWSLMGYGNYLNDGNTPPNYSVYDKYYLGWLEPIALAQTQTLEIPADGVTTYMLASSEKHVDEGAYRTDTVYYIENRQQKGWDAYLPGHGMLIWRVIFNEDDWYQNCPNDHVARYRLISAVTASSPYTTTKPKPEVPFPGSKNITKYTPFSHNGLYNIQEVNGLITCEFTTTTIHSAVENIQVPRTGVWYNILGQPIDPNNYKGVAIHDNKKYLLR
jgi:M6 family metalloprotease-like protein